MCSNTTSGGGSEASNVRKNLSVEGVTSVEIFEEGTWKGKDFNLAQDYANKVRMIKPYYNGYNRSTFVGTMIGLIQKDVFDLNEFMHKLRLQPTALVDCANREQYRTLIEDIYNWRSRQKVNLRY
jgi:hypothetical protein